MTVLPQPPAASSSLTETGAALLGKRTQEEPDLEEPSTKLLRLLPSISLPLIPGLRAPSLSVKYEALFPSMPTEIHGYSDASVHTGAGFACVAWLLVSYGSGDR